MFDDVKCASREEPMNPTSGLSCGCKGTRFCKVCQHTERVRQIDFNLVKGSVRPGGGGWRERLAGYSVYEFCSICQTAYRAVSVSFPQPPNEQQNPENETNSSDGTAESPAVNNIEQEQALNFIQNYRSLNPARLSAQEFHRLHESESDERVPLNPPLRGCLVLENFVNETEEKEIMKRIDETDIPWLQSQSGRRKQDFGPKVNFKKQKVKLDPFVGVPKYCDLLLKRMAERSPDHLSNYVALEQCNLEYAPERGSAIDFHQDDFWIWGERLISINMLSGTVITLVNDTLRTAVLVPMPRHSLLAMFSDVRFKWLHGILEEHIEARRVAVTMREPQTEFCPGGSLYDKYGRDLLEKCALRV